MINDKNLDKSNFWYCPGSGCPSSVPVIYISPDGGVDHLRGGKGGLILIMKHSSKTNGDKGKPLKTEHPLSEKDEQARRLEGVRKLQAEALKLWHALMKKK